VSASSPPTVAFAHDGTKVLTGSEDGSVGLWRAPAPLTGNVARIRLWVEVCTGQELGPSSNAVLSLDAAAWRQRLERLQDMGGPPRAE
jgi:hypothetical protein